MADIFDSIDLGKIEVAKPKQDIFDSIEEPTVGGIFGKVPVSQYQQGERNIIGNIFERPGTAVRSALQGKGYQAGAVNPTNVPTFQNLAIQKAQSSTNPIANIGLGMQASALGLAADIVTNPADVLTSLIPFAPGIKQAGQALSKTKPFQEFGKFLTKERNLIKPIEVKQNEIIDNAIEKAVRPSVAGKSNAYQYKTYQTKAREAVKTILDNKDNISFLDEAGQPVNKLPETLKEFNEAIGQTKSSIYKQYNQLAKEAGEEGGFVDLKSVSKELNGVISNKSLNIKDPNIVQYTKDLQQRLASQGRLSPEEAEDLIRVYNQSLEAFYRNPSYDTASKAVVDVGIVNNLRKSLDSSITNLTGKQYQTLKNQYGALATLEKDVSRRAIVDARKNNKGLIDFTDVFSGGDIVRGVLTLDPTSIAKGIAQKGIAQYFKNLNNPNAIIKNMFKQVGENYVPRQAAITPEILNLIPGDFRKFGQTQALPGNAPIGLPKPKDVPYNPSGSRGQAKPIITPNAQQNPIIQGENPVKKLPYKTIITPAPKKDIKGGLTKGTERKFGEISAPKVVGTGIVGLGLSSKAEAMGNNKKYKTVPSDVKLKIAKAENGGKTDGDWAQLEQIVLDDLQGIGKLDKNITLKQVKSDPALYDHVSALYLKRLDDFGIPDKDKPLWWLMPGRYKSSGGNVDNLKSKEFRNIMKNRIKNMGK